MKVILLQDVTNLGSKDESVIVKDGYGRNYLIPQKMAILSTPSAAKVLAENQKQRAHKEAKLKEEALKMAEQLKTISIAVGAKTSSTGKIFGSVNNIQIAEALKEKGFDVDRKQIMIKQDSIKEIGTHTVKIKLHREVVVEYSFEVVSE
jgi:large subunit ribosomal protein L9